MIKLYNTLSRKKEAFEPLKDNEVGLYTCGPTVYWFSHIGNLRTYFFEDILKRVLEHNEYKVTHIMNVTDVGHLTSDSDTGEDKMEMGAKRERKTVWEIADFYTRAFKKDLKSLNIKPPNIWVKATSTIGEQIKFIQVLEKKGFTYKIADGVYFDTSKIKNYGKLCGSKKRELKAGSRVKVAAGKKNSADFALWKFSPLNVKRQMEWDSPWAPPGVRGKVKGFPGWHTECVVMAVKYLGVPFDIHCGGIDHIPIHHTNEIAQAEAAFGKNLANFWLHGEFLILKEGRMGKSERNIITLSNLSEKGFNPLSYRYLCLTTHYRSKLTFSWKSLQSGQQALNNLYQKIREIETRPLLSSSQRPDPCQTYQRKFLEFINNDLDTPKALALMWDMIKDKSLSQGTKYRLLITFDEVFGLNLSKVKKLEIPAKVKKLIAEREKCRKADEWENADALRKSIQEMGYRVEDTKEGTQVKKTH